MDWHGCPDPSAYCPPEHCSDPVAHHRIQARKRVEAAFAGSASRTHPPSITFRGFAEERVTARTLFSEAGNAARPHFDPVPFLTASGTTREAVSDGGNMPVDSASQGICVPRGGNRPELVLPSIHAKPSAMSTVPLLKLNQLKTMPDGKQAKSMSARNATSAFKSNTQRGAKTARDIVTGWQPLRNRPKREEHVDPEQLLKILCPEMYQDLKVLLDKDFVQKVSLVRMQSDLEGDVQQRLRAIIAEEGAKESTEADGARNPYAGELEGTLNMSTAPDGLNNGFTSERGAASVSGSPRTVQTGVRNGDRHAENYGSHQKEGAVCRPMLPQLYLGNLENDPSFGNHGGKVEPEGGASTRMRNRQAVPLRELPQARRSSAQDRFMTEGEDSVTNSVTASRKRRSSSSNKALQTGTTQPKRKTLALEIDTTLKKKMERLTAELDEYKQKVKDLEVQLSVTSPRQAEERMTLLEARWQEQILAMEKQYRTKVENIRAAHRTELADWKASEVDNLRRAMERACEAKLRLAMEERAALEKRLAEMQQQVLVAAESASHDRALRAPLEEEIARLRRQSKLNDGRSRALEKELIELHNKAGDAKGVARLLTERVAAQPAFSRHLSLLSDLPGSPRHSLGLSESLDSAGFDSPNGTLDGKVLSRSFSSLSPIPDASPTDRTPTEMSLSRLASTSDASHLAGGALRSVRGSTESAWGPSSPQTARGRRATVAYEADMGLATSASVKPVLAEGQLERIDSPAAKRALLTLSPPSLHTSIELSGLDSPSVAGVNASAESPPAKAASVQGATVPAPKPIVFPLPARLPQEKKDARGKMRITVR